MRNALVFFLVLVLGCTGDDLPPPSSPRDPAYARAPETRFDPGVNPLVRNVPAPPAGSANPHAGHQMGGMGPAPSGSTMPMPMPKMP